MSATVTVTRADLERARAGLTYAMLDWQEMKLTMSAEAQAVLKLELAADTAALERIQAALAAQPEAGA